ncbi:hypothetical protein [Capnocytophaga catalasegens]|uniref:Uncharacterized protein n=1 Tax=Capnocytophaga catalasegens TaxID=1004260 RepID=A0AAV5AZD3_9FLAO|nr:hypothetical protein [Capnocytophaga catalasegens]GIZ16098.1 hypothetical protein RCZ03_20980 [Capnocytophaga catalasegens]GJM50257.1 hypothetical protein RCZ15_12300 [Capnocytophaga catalasegens]GJM53488.1 hypothetical protein RCZ16_18040 [Capnocytophaga catalasegens]
MALKNLAQVTFTTEELEKMDNALQILEEVLKGKTYKLSAEQRRQFGRIAEQNKLFVNKSKELMEQYPQYIPSFLNKNEFDQDYEARIQIENRLIRIQSIAEQLSDTKILLDHDNYSGSITFYQNIKFLYGQNIPGIKTIFDSLKQFFKGGRRKKTDDLSSERTL